MTPDAPQGGEVSPETGTPTDVAGYLSTASALALVMAVVLYGIGIVIVNIYLARYGVADLALARPEYVMAGGLWVFLVAGVSAAFRSAIHFARDCVKRDHTWLRRLGSAVSAAVWFLFPMALLEAVQGSAVGLRKYAVAVVILYFNAYAVWDVASGLRNRLKGASKSLPASHFQELVLLIIAVSLYALFVAPLIPKQFGGTRPQEVRLVLRSGTAIARTALDSALQYHGGVLGPAALLVESEVRVVVARLDTDSLWPRPQPALGIERSRIKAILYARRPPSGRTQSPNHADSPSAALLAPAVPGRRPL